MTIPQNLTNCFRMEMSLLSRMCTYWLVTLTGGHANHRVAQQGTARLDRNTVGPVGIVRHRLGAQANASAWSMASNWLLSCMPQSSGSFLRGRTRLQRHWRAASGRYSLVAPVALNKLRRLLFITPLGLGWIWKAPMQALGHAGEDRAALGVPCQSALATCENLYIHGK